MEENYLAALTSLHLGYYNHRLHELAYQYGSLQDLYEYLQRKPKGSVPQESILDELRRVWTKDNLVNLQERCRRDSIQLFTEGDAAYPGSLRHIPDPPYVLFVQGDSALLNNPAFTFVSMVGTRSISTYGKRVVTMLVDGLKGYDVCLVSGLALGIDAAVHAASLRNHIPTIAVLGGGLDRHEPLTNSALAQEILRSGGCIVSEYPPTVRPQKHHFLERNRIISGITQATVVIEGKHHSGSLVTARYALQQGRDVATVPGDIFMPNSEGPLRLLREGAWPITVESDLIEFLGLTIHEKKEIKNEDNPVYVLLSAGQALSLEQIHNTLALPMEVLQQHITDLELDDNIALSSSGEYYVK